MEYKYQVASPTHLNELFTFAHDLFIAGEPSPEKTIALWHARWRKESLEHYLHSGWSFIGREASDTEDGGKISGFFLAQPMLHVRGYTQTLWIETIQAANEYVSRELFDIAVRIAREKHLQRVWYSTDNSEKVYSENAALKWAAIELAGPFIEIRTTKG